MRPSAGRARSAYVLCGTPRTGSTLLCSLLRATEVAGRPESYFREPDEAMWAMRWNLPVGDRGALDYRSFVRAAVAAENTDNGVFGVRVMWGTMDHLLERLAPGRSRTAEADLRLLDDHLGPTRFLHLWREDTVAQAVSWVRAEQTGYWQRGDKVPAGWTPVFDAVAVAHTVTAIRDHDAAWRTWFARHSVRPHAVRYEDLVHDPPGVTRAVLDFLGLDLPAGTRIEASEQRQADGLNDEWIAAYRALRPTPRDT